jgi:hypothetical protein
MPMPGDTRRASCTWCNRPDVVQTFRLYPPGAGVPGGYYDTGACPCGDLSGWIKMGAAQLALLERRDATSGRPNRGRRYRFRPEAVGITKG